MANKKSKEWGRAILCKPKDNLTTEAGIRAQRHVLVSSIEKGAVPISMTWIIGWEYARIWLKDRDEFVTQRDNKQKTKIIKNDFEWWLKLRKTHKCFCPL